MVSRALENLERLALLPALHGACASLDGDDWLRAYALSADRSMRAAVLSKAPLAVG